MQGVIDVPKAASNDHAGQEDAARDGCAWSDVREEYPASYKDGHVWLQKFATIGHKDLKYFGLPWQKQSSKTVIVAMTTCELNKIEFLWN